MCLDRITTLGVCPDDSVSTSGFTLMQAPGMSIKNLAAITDERFAQGVAFAMEKKTLSINQVKTDFLRALQTNNVITTTGAPAYNTSIFNAGMSVGTYAGERGVTIHKNTSYRGRLRETSIKAVNLFPLESGEGQLIIVDATGTEHFWNVNFIANQVNTFDADNLDGFPFVLPNINGAVRVLVDQTTIPFASAKITCLKGCNNTLPNPCGWAEGWNGTGAVKDEGYGVDVEFTCECNYSQILCDQAKSFTGELIWLKWQINIFEEQLKTSRFNNIVIYKNDEIKENYLPELEEKYQSLWSDWMAGILGVLKQYRDECLKCNGIRWEVNL